MTFQQIKYVIEIARCGKISKAAENLFIAQPHLSSSLKDLENQLGIEIFTRSQKGVKLTDDGKNFIKYAQPIYEQQEQLLKMYKNKSIPSKLRFAMSCQRFSFAIKAFCDIFRNMDTDSFDIYLREKDMYEVIQDVCNQKSDIGIISIFTYTEDFIKKYLSSLGLEFHIICSVTPKIHIHPTHPLAHKDEISIDEISKYPYVTFDCGSPSIDFAEEIMLVNSANNSKNFFVSDDLTAVNLMTHAGAYTIGTGLVVPSFSGANSVCRPVKGYGRIIKIGYVVQKGSALPEIYYKYISRLKKLIDEIT